MIRQLKLKCFRQHEDRVFTFGEGLVCLKGVNESGKSTILEAVMYALYGAKALRNSLADTVTWGHKETELKVELTVELQGRLFNFKRGKSGAECEYDGGLVTGQNEVSAFAAELMGGDANLVSRLMMANQGNLRGALEEGPKAVAAQIENLADFDLFDRLIEAASEKWVLGSPATLEDRLKTARDALSALDVTPPDLSPLQAQIEAADAQAVAAQTQIDTVLLPAQRLADAAYQSAQTVQRMYDGVVNSLRRSKEQRDLHVEQQKAAAVKAAVVIDVGQIKVLEAQLSDASAAASRRAAYQRFSALTYPAAFWEGNRQGFLDELDRLNASIQENETAAQGHERTMAAAQGNVRALTSKVVTSMICPTCGQEFKNVADMVAQNAKINAEIDAAHLTVAEGLGRAKGYRTAAAALRTELDELKAVQRSAGPIETVAAECGQYLTVGTHQYPPQLVWVGGVPPAVELDVRETKFQISKIQADLSDIANAAARVEALTQTLNEDDEQVMRLTGQLNEFGDLPSVDALQTTAREAGNAAAVERVRVGQYRDEVARLGAEVSSLKAAYQAAVQRRDDAEQAVKVCEGDLAKLNFNNNLMKKIRTARPQIADQLWKLVLASVSTMFSQMRGDRSVVTKGKDGFAVNGESVSSLSGSTLDALGLAIRVALVKTFLPHTTFMSVDEPCSGMDHDRTVTVLGYLKSLGLSQVILISHEATAEAVADHVIQL